MASMRDIKRRKSSITSTQQITKAMKLVSTVKLQKARAHAEATDPYFNYMYRTVSSMLAKSGNLEHPYLKAGDSTSNRGLAGGYNSNIVKLITHGDFKKEEIDIYAVGAKGEELLTSKGYHIVESAPEMMEDLTYEDAAALCKRVLKAFTDGQVGEIYLAYTHFKNTVTQEAKLIKLLPVELDESGADEKEDSNILMNFEPNPEEALELIIPKYVTSLFYGALVESFASENGARMQAMDSATSNAEDMISDLTLKYNRARQGSITQELTEIIAGANAIE